VSVERITERLNTFFPKISLTGWAWG